MAKMTKRGGLGSSNPAGTFSKDDTQMVKGLAIILMIIHHCFLSPNRYKGQEVVFAPLSEGLFNSVALSFKICVALFVFISAYGITYSYRRQSQSYDLDAPMVTRSVLKRLVSMIGGFLFVFMLAQLYSLVVVRDGRYLKVYGEGLLGVLHFVLDGLGLAEMFSTPTFLATFWYMSLAVIIVMLVPVLLRLYKGLGAMPLLFFALLFRVLFVPTSDVHYCYLPNYLFCIVMGIWSADRNLIGSIDGLSITRSRTVDGIIKLLIALALGAGCMYFRQKTRDTALLPFWDGCIPVLTCYVVHAYIGRVPILNKVLGFLGKHSMNIFLTHNFVRIMWYYDFTYSFRYWWLIVLVLLLISLGISIVIEALKRLVRYDRAVVMVRNACDKV